MIYTGCVPSQSKQGLILLIYKGESKTKNLCNSLSLVTVKSLPKLTTSDICEQLLTIYEFQQKLITENFCSLADFPHLYTKSLFPFGISLYFLSVLFFSFPLFVLFWFFFLLILYKLLIVIIMY